MPPRRPHTAASSIRLPHRLAAPRRSNGRSRRASNTRRPGTRAGAATLFHAPSFSAGVVMGAVVVLGAAYLPELLSAGPEPVPAAAAVEPAQPEPALTFEFDHLLRNSRVSADPAPYVPPPPPEATAEPEVIVLQAASFRSRDDAERLRAALLLMDLPAATSAITLDNGAWYRVTVGPFHSRIQAERALTRLREKDIAAIWTRR